MSKNDKEKINWKDKKYKFAVEFLSNPCFMTGSVPFDKMAYSTKEAQSIFEPLKISFQSAKAKLSSLKRQYHKKLENQQVASSKENELYVRDPRRPDFRFPPNFQYPNEKFPNLHVQNSPTSFNNNHEPNNTNETFRSNFDSYNQNGLFKQLPNDCFSHPTNNQSLPPKFNVINYQSLQNLREVKKPEPTNDQPTNDQQEEFDDWSEENPFDKSLMDDSVFDQNLKSYYNEMKRKMDNPNRKEQSTERIFPKRETPKRETPKRETPKREPRETSKRETPKRETPLEDQISEESSGEFDEIEFDDQVSFGLKFEFNSHGVNVFHGTEDERFIVLVIPKFDSSVTVNAYVSSITITWTINLRIPDIPTNFRVPKSFFSELQSNFSGGSKEMTSIVELKNKIDPYNHQKRENDKWIFMFYRFQRSKKSTTCNFKENY